MNWCRRDFIYENMRRICKEYVAPFLKILQKNHWMMILL